MKKGFTLLEILVAVGIIVLLCVIIIGSFSSFRKNQEFDNAIEDAVSVLNSAKSKTLSSENASQYGVHLETSRIVLFTGTTFTESNVGSNPSNQITKLPNSVELVNISLNGGGSDVVFKRLTGDTDKYGSFIIRLKSDVSKNKTIEIKSTGIINVL